MRPCIRTRGSGGDGGCVALQLAVVYVAPLRQVLRTVPLAIVDRGVVGLWAFTPFVMIGLVKLGQTRFRTTADAPREPIMRR